MKGAHFSGGRSSPIDPAPGDAKRYEGNKMNELQESIIQALKMLIEADIDLIETQPKEESINHKLAQYLEAVLKKKNLLGRCSVDIEYNKYREGEKKGSNGHYIRPDIISHKRRSGNEDNLMVIEAKKNYDDRDDRKKVRDLVDSQDYRYSVGAVISYFPKREHVKIKFYVGGQWKKYLMSKTDFTLTETRR